MELPKIKNENLPKELKEILGDGDAEFEAIVAVSYTHLTLPTKRIV